MKLFWRDHTGGSHPAKRVWREDWSGDQFEVLPPMSFAILSTAVHDLNRVMASTIIELEQTSDD